MQIVKVILQIDLSRDGIPLSLFVSQYDMRIFDWLLKEEIICNRVLADASYECRHSLYYLEAKVVDYLLLSDFALEVEFS